MTENEFLKAKYFLKSIDDLIFKFKNDNPSMQIKLYQSEEPKMERVIKICGSLLKIEVSYINSDGSCTENWKPLK